ncbi:hypothetical protein Egran_03711 [Elaphomyces granulatus]|uniref:Uncharacterized protein n=1 Tax=Elaphomyces granulatus TaxID=519963 RepID=A0A232LWM7_9EURO|nr:hypothetical protein Egran_03711 [Elaphomyces granulatus]
MAEYFASITSPSAFGHAFQRRFKDHPYNFNKIPASSSWSLDELLVCRVVCSTTEFTPVPQVVFDVPAIKRLIKGPELDRTRTSTELLQKYLRDLQELGPFPSSLCSGLRSRSRNPPSRPGMVDSESMQITPDSPSEAPSSQSSSSGSYHQNERFHPVPEDATIEVARAFIQHVLLHIPSQKTVSASGATLDAPPDPLIEFSGVRKQRSMAFAGNRTIQATADGELEFWVWNATHHRYNLEPARRLALLEAKLREDR